MNSLTNVDENFNSFIEKINEIFKNNILEKMDFQEFIKQFFPELLGFGRNIVGYFIRLSDDLIAESPFVKENFTSKGFSKKTIITELGNVTINRRRFNAKENQKENINNLLALENSDNELANSLFEKINGQESKDIYLLDFFLNLDGTIAKGITDNFLFDVVKASSEMSFRKAATNIERFSTVNISHTKVWSFTQQFAEVIEDFHEKKNELNKEGKLEHKNNKSEIIFKETDGVQLPLQGKDRKEQFENYKKKHGTDEVPKKVRNKTFYLAIAYDGKKPGVGTSKELNNKIVVGGYEFSKLTEIFETELDGFYDRDNIKYEILNTDGETLLNKLINEKTYYQADAFHIKEKITGYVATAEDRKMLIDLYHENKPEEMLDYIEEIKYKCGGVETEIDKLETLKSYIEKRKDKLLPYQKLEGMQEFLDELSKKTNLEYSNLGCQESTNYQVSCQRMKKQRMAWSIKGALNMIRIKSFFESVTNKERIRKSGFETLEEIGKTREELAELWIQEIEQHIKEMKQKNREEKKTQKSKFNPSSVPTGTLPAFLKNIGNLNKINDLGYI